ncbi:MAG: acyl-CoA dehydrogenase, partial [Gemmatimonadetes bacterium]|nr:acyl-CoA dehydrogenase [Gemmatimonadota bacterium]
HALTDPEGRPARRSTCFIVPMDAPGVAYQEMAGKHSWMQSSTGSIAFDDVVVPEDAILGELNEGFK